MPGHIKNNLTVIIVSFNSGNVIIKNLSELIHSSICNIIVVDNASTDGSQEVLEKNFPLINLIRLPANIGYGRAANIALKKIDTDYGLLINPDILLSKDSLKNIFNNALKSEKESAIFSPALRREDFLMQGDISVDYLIGAFLLFKMDVLRKMGYFDENIFLFYEEKDLELRLIKSGYELVLQSNIYVKHFRSASTKSSEKIIFLRNWHVAWSKLYFSKKHKLSKYSISAYFLLLKYGFKYFINDGNKRIKYKARYMGAQAYLRGEKSFTEAGVGKHAEKIA